MKRAKLALGAVVLSFALVAIAAFSQQATHPPTLSAFPQAAKPAARDTDVPAELQSALAKLQSAKNDLDHAGGDWGGFRVKAISNIEEAEANLKKAQEWHQAHK